MQKPARTLFGALLATLVVLGTAVAGPGEDAIAAYERGDFATALRLWQPLADQSDAVAQYNLGVMYDNGRGVTQNDAEAVKWYRKAADQGNAYSQYGLGLAYANGEGVPQNYAEAAKWYRKAADQGIAHAQLNLGVMYFNGEGVLQNYIQAHMWWNLAAANPISEKETRDKAVRNRDLVASKMTPAQVAEAQKLARAVGGRWP